MSNILINQDSPSITVQSEPLSLNIYTSGISFASGNAGDLQYNANGTFGGVPTANYSNGNLNLGNVSNTKLLGGTNGYFLQTDGTGNLTFVPGTANITGNGTAAGSNNQIQMTDGTGNFKASAGFTFDTSSNLFSSPGNAVITGEVAADAFDGNLVTANYANISVDLNGNTGNFTGNLVTTGTTKIQQALEKTVLDSNAATGTINFDIITQSILYKTSNASANFIVNIRGNSTVSLDTFMSNSQSLTLRLLNKNGNIGYYANAFQIDGTNVSPLWISSIGTPSIGTANGIDVYDLEIIKTNANTYTVLAIQTGYN
jgi:hypothetical protein